MEENKNNKKVIERIQGAIDKLNKKDFIFYFFVIDSKGYQSAIIRYIYELAKNLIDNGYNATLLYQGKDIVNGKEEDIKFIGVESWMGVEYSSLPHARIDSQNIKVGANDFLFIPETFANVMNETKDLPCKRIVLCQNLNYATEFIPLGVSWVEYKIFNVLTTSNWQEKDVLDLFPYVSAKVVEPSIPSYFRPSQEPKKLIIPILCKDKSTIDKVTKQFLIRYPQYKWVTFAPMIGLDRNVFAELLGESAFTIWIDDDCYFGYSAVEAIKSGSIVIGKIPNVIPDWMYNEDKTDFLYNGLWFNDIRDIYKLIAQAITLWMEDEIPPIMQEHMKITSSKYTDEQKLIQVKQVFGEYVTDRVKELEELINNLK